MAKLNRHTRCTDCGGNPCTTGALIHEGETDYSMPSTESTVWITVGGVAIYIFNHPDAVRVSLFRNGSPCNDEDIVDGCAAQKSARFRRAS